ncbi:MAG: HlyD family efflux transporter periplasmic adaptor subunit [Cyclobacteriaceae bacterium]|nr:HlyD family efflux transporter periplasmic adaptor subunit [Cyclobacteriaceae bacterium]
MSNHKIIPSAALEQSINSNYRFLSIKSRIIYLSACIILVLLICSSFILVIPISIQSSALIRPSSEISLIRPLLNGRLKTSLVKENQIIKKGEILYNLESDIQQEREKLLLLKKQDIEFFMFDLKNLLVNAAGKDLTTALYRQSYFNYKQKLTEATTRLKKVQADYNRNYKLHQEKVIADVEFENFQFELDKAKNELELVKQSQLSQWQSELRTYERELQDLEGQLAQLAKENENLVIKAPVSGTLQKVAGVYPGSMVFANQELAQISPDTTMIVEAYVTPNDIGLIRAGMPVRFQVNAFNYNQWGLATGIVKEISSDVHIINDQPVFKVRCQLDKDYLQLKNGYKGYLKKGMTLQARFMVTERTLWQLLYDKMDDWLNPNLLQPNN